MRTTAFLAGVLVLSANAFAVDTQLLNMVMPEAQIMAGGNVATGQISPFGQYVLSQFRSDDPGFQDFISQTGFDPRQDVTEILAATTGNPGLAGGLVLARGNFDANKIGAIAAAKGGDSVAVSQSSGATLITGKNAKSVAFLGNSVAVIGDTASVKASLDRAGGVNSISPALATRVQSLSASLDAWTVSLASIASLMPSELGGKSGAMAQPLQLVKNIESSSGGVKFGANVEVSGQAVANTEENAKALADIVRMVASLVTMSGTQDPKMAGVAQLVQTLKVTTDGTAVNLSASVPEAQLEALLHPPVATKN